MKIRDKEEFSSQHSLLRNETYLANRKRRLDSLLREDLRQYNITCNKHRRVDIADAAILHPNQGIILNHSNQFSLVIQQPSIGMSSFPPREALHRHAKAAPKPTEQSESDTETPTTFTPHDISEIIRLREEEDYGFFMIASLLQKDEKAVREVYYRRIRDLEDMKEPGRGDNETPKQVVVALDCRNGNERLYNTIDAMEIGQSETPIAKFGAGIAAHITPIQQTVEPETPVLNSIDGLIKRQTSIRITQENAQPSPSPQIESRGSSGILGETLKRVKKVTKRAAIESGLLSNDQAEKKVRYSDKVSTGNSKSVQGIKRSPFKLSFSSLKGKSKSPLADQPVEGVQACEPLTAAVDGQAYTEYPMPTKCDRTMEGGNGGPGSPLTSISSSDLEELSSESPSDNGGITHANLVHINTHEREKEIFEPRPSHSKSFSRLSFVPESPNLLTREEISRFIDPMLLSRFNPALRKKDADIAD
ncbi:hypothetical protein ABW19_dt0206518 [Dactylella cylindrospora]|nr:hypothetical protein ABW19_dt0206518 [Dactylella cylindrospora]